LYSEEIPVYLKSISSRTTKMRSGSGSMSVPYLDRGETIILTTHRVSVGNTEYDALLTTKRLILMDRRYTRFEPRMIHFPSIVTVKAGRIPAGEPAIVLTLEQPSDMTGSERVNIIFLQEPGEDRKTEREQWVKELIALVIASREQGIRNQISTPSKKAGVQPSVRRWVAPDSPIPHTTHEPPIPSTPEPEVIAESPDPMEFFLETRIPEMEISGKMTEPEANRNTPRIPETSTHEIPIPHREPPHWPKIQPSASIIPVTEEPVPGTGYEESEQGPVPAAQPATDPATAEIFARLIASAAESLQVKKGQPSVKYPGEPETADEVPSSGTDGPGLPPLNEYRGSPLTASSEPEVQEHPVRSSQSSSGKAAVPVTPAPGSLRELPGTYIPDIPVPVTPRAGESTPLEHEQPIRKYKVITGILLVLVLLAVFGCIVILFPLPPVQQSNLPIVTITPSVPIGTVAVTESTVSSPVGIEVRIEYPGSFFGTVGNPGYLHPVSGTGNSSFKVLMLTSVVQATLQKQDNSGDVLMVGIYNNSIPLIKKSVSAPKGSVNILVDVDTGLPPGLNVTGGGSATLLGNGSLIYY